METPKKNNKVFIVLTSIIFLLIGIIVSLILPEKELVNEDDVNKETDNTSNNENVKKYIQEDIENIIENNLNSLLNKTSLEELTNQERLRLLISLYPHNNYGTIAISDLKEIHATSCIKNLNVKYTDVYDYYTYFSSDEQGDRLIAYKYDESAGTLTYTGALGHGVGTIAYPINKELISFEENNNEYTIEYKYIFGNKSGEGPAPWTLYYSGIDAYKGENAFKKFDYDCNESNKYCSDYGSEANTYIKENYDNIKDKLPIYAYTFKIEDSDLVITSFSVSEW